MVHEQTMDLALDLAGRGWGRVSPNPLVGAVVCAPDGSVIGCGWHEGPGTPHAEVMALVDAAGRTTGSTLVCTLEPCDRHGRTPPCTDAIVAAGVSRVVIAATDPNLGEGEPGVRALRAAGIEVITGVRASASRRLNAAYESHIRSGRPFVVWKTAATLDGKTAATDGSSRWVTSPEARADAHHLRAWADAVVVGSRTAAVDDPSLTVRDSDPDARQPMRVLVDAAGRVGTDGRLFDASAPTLVATTDRASAGRLAEWRAAGAEVIVVGRDVTGGVDLARLLEHLGKLDVQGVLLEGGATLAWSFIRDDLIDRVVAYIAPLLLGGSGATGIVAGGGFASLADARSLTFTALHRVGPDLKVEADVHRDR